MPSLPIVSIWPETSHRRLSQALTVLTALGLGVPAVSESRPRDRDDDGLSNRVELRKTHTSPHRADTDRDGLGDRIEVRRTHTNPRRADTDRDGLGDRVEVRKTHTNPSHPDTDGDGLRDGFEVPVAHEAAPERHRRRWLARRARASLEDGSASSRERRQRRLVVPPPIDTAASGDIRPLRPLRDGQRRLGKLRVQLVGGRIDLPVPPDGGVWERMQLAEGVLRPRKRLAYVRRPGDGRRR